MENKYQVKYEQMASVSQSKHQVKQFKQKHKKMKKETKKQVKQVKEQVEEQVGQPKQKVEKLQNGLYLVENEDVKMLVTNLGTALKEATHDEVEAIKTLHPEEWEKMQLAAMVAIDNMVNKEARK